jgi:16S rRNA processing protein RimM
MRKKYLECGKIVSTHGVRGELRVQPWCDSPEYLLGFKTLYLKNGETAVAVENARVSKNIVLMKLKGVDTLDGAVSLRGRVLYMDRDDAPETGGEFIQDLIGLDVFDADTGRLWGKLADVLPTGANDVYALKDEAGKERLVPVIPDVIVETDIDAGLIRIRPLKGLFDDED